MLIVQFQRGSQPVADASPVTLRCPACRDSCAFAWTGVPDLQGIEHRVALRICPHPSCRAVVLVVWKGNQIVDAYPPQVIDFNPNGIPPKVVSAFGEALICHANGCETAAALMVRKALELLCEAQGVKGDNLKARLAGLKQKVLLPAALFDGLDELRLLGNDAAHVESKDYDSIGKDEVEIGIEVTKEVLKAVYQHEGLVKRLQGLKKPAGPAK